VNHGLNWQDDVLKPGSRPTNPAIPGSAHQANGTGNCGICGTQIQDGEWDVPFPLESAPLPRFPIDCLGDGLRAFVAAAAESLQVPVDLVVFSVLAVVSNATGGRRRVLVKPQWTESTALWMVALADSSERKTPALDIAAAPLREIENELIEDARPGVEEDAQEIRITTQRMAKAEQMAADSTKALSAKTDASRGDAEDAREKAKSEAKAARDRLAELGDGRQLPRLLFRDITLEALGKLMADQGGRIGSLASEGGLFKVAAGLYGNKSQANVDLMLEAYTGGAYTIDRLGRAGARMESTFLALALIIQPGILGGIEKVNPEFRHSGMLGRFLYGRPTPVETDLFDSPPMPEGIEEAYAKALRAMVERIWATSDTVVLRLDDDARKRFAEFYDEFGKRRKIGGDLHEIADWAGKLRGQLIRIAACLTLYDNPETRSIPLSRIEDAIAMAPYFICHAKAAFDLMGADAEGKRKPLRDVVAWLRSRKQPCRPFSQQETWQALKGRKWAETADDVKDALRELEDDGWISAIPPEDEPGKRGRKKSPRYEVHPWIARPPNASHKSQNSTSGSAYAGVPDD